MTNRELSPLQAAHLAGRDVHRRKFNADAEPLLQCRNLFRRHRAQSTWKKIDHRRIDRGSRQPLTASKFFEVHGRGSRRMHARQWCRSLNATPTQYTASGFFNSHAIENARTPRKFEAPSSSDPRSLSPLWQQSPGR